MNTENSTVNPRPDTSHLRIPPMQPIVPAPQKPPVPYDQSLSRDTAIDTVKVDWHGLRALLFACGPKSDKNERVDVLIAALADSGITKGKQIVAIITHLGFNAQHVGIRLTRYGGDAPRDRQWHRDQEGKYRPTS